MLTKKSVMGFVAGIAAVYHILMVSNTLAYLGIFILAAQHRAISLIFVILIAYMLFSVKREKNYEKMQWFDYLFLTAGLIGGLFPAIFYEKVVDYSLYGFLDVKGQILTLLLIISLLEGVRRATGWVLPILITSLLLLTSFQSYLPGFMKGVSYPFDQLSYSVYVGTGGIYGFTLGVASTIIISYLIFAEMFNYSGAGRWFVNMAMSIAGRATGGPAKAAVVGSAFFGMISGSASGNTASTGTFTIPLMKKIGFEAPFAAAVEACASAGGQILPPVMGSVAFIMAEWLGISYANVVKYAVIPAVLYFTVLFFAVHFKAKKIGMRPQQYKDIPNLKEAFLSGWYYLIPIATLIFVLFSSFGNNQPEFAALFSLPVLIAVSFLAKDRKLWLTPKRIWQALSSAACNWVTVAIILATVGMLTGALDISGLGYKLSSFLVLLGGGKLVLTLILVAIASLILGMGMEISASYITLATLTAPVLITLGLSDVQAHLFIIYWGVASFITPPVCLTVYVACSISGSKLWETGWQAVRTGAGVYLVSFAFALNDTILLQGSVIEIIFAAITAVVGAITVSAAVQGFFLMDMKAIERIFLGVAGVLLFDTDVIVNTAAIVVLTIIFIKQMVKLRLEQKQSKELPL